MSNRYVEYKYKNKKKLILSVTSGRCGTAWLANIFSAHRNARGSSERYMNVEAIWRFMHYHKLPIDCAGVIEILKMGIVSDWEEHEISMINSPFLSHECRFLFNSLLVDKLIWGITDIRFTVQSFLQKGWYDNDFFMNDVNKISCVQPAYRNGIAYSFSRLVPCGEEYDIWKKLTRVGKISWFVSMINEEIYSNIKNLDKKKLYIFKLEVADQNYEWYKDFANKFGFSNILSKEAFLSLKWKVMKRNDEVKNNQWSDKEEQEFLIYAKKAVDIYQTVKSW